MKWLSTLLIAMAFAFTALASTINYTQTQHAGPTASSNAQWAAMDGSDTAQAFKTANYREKSVQIDGTFLGTTVSIQGSNNGTSWTTLVDQANAALTCTSACLKTVQQMTLYIRPSVSGSASAAITVDMHLKSK